MEFPCWALDAQSPGSQETQHHSNHTRKLGQAEGLKERRWGEEEGRRQRRKEGDRACQTDP